MSSFACCLGFPPSMWPKTIADCSRLESQIDCYINLLASAHRVPSFLIMRGGHVRSVGTSPVTPESERILIRWFARDSQLHERDQLAKLSHLTAALNRAGVFLFALANALDTALCQTYCNRRDTFLVHSAIMSTWLELSSIDNVAELSERWHRSLHGSLTEQFKMDHATADEMPSDQLDYGDKLAWQLIQTHRLGAKFRRAYSQHVGAAV